MVVKLECSLSKVSSFGEDTIAKIFLKLLPPVMFAQLIQAVYSITDSFFVGDFAESGLTALSIVYPIQLLLTALSVGTGVGINTAMASRFGIGQKKEAEQFAGIGTPLAVVIWFVFAVIAWILMPGYVGLSTQSKDVMNDAVTYGRIISVFSFGLFLEGTWTKVLQANGDMRTPMIAQITGAVINIALDPLLIFGWLGLPEMGVAGAAISSVIGQIAAALIVMRKGFRKPPRERVYFARIAEIFRFGLPNILMQAAYTFYILGLNMVLAGFSDQAVTALGLYYKWQTFFFIPLGAMQTCVVPVISYNYAARNIQRCKKILLASLLTCGSMMAVGLFCYMVFPLPMLQLLTSDIEVIEIGKIGFRIVGASLLPMVTSLIFPVLFQATGFGLKSSLLTVVRTIVLFVPLGYLFSRFGLTWFWFTFPVTESLTSLLGFLFYKKFCNSPYVKQAPLIDKDHPTMVVQPSKPGVIVTIAREHGSSGKEIGRLVAERMGIPFYYKEMTVLAAQESGMDKEFVSGINKNAPQVLYNLYLSSKVVRLAVTAQHRIIEKIAENGSCVIVGRAADHVLRDHDGVVRVFIHAPKEYRIGRVMEVYGDTRKEAERNIRHSDKARAAYYHSISGKQWNDARNYDFTLNADCGVEEAAMRIVKLLANR